MRKIIALVKHMIFGWKIMAAVKIVTDWIFLFGFSFIQCHVTSFPYLDCAWGWSLQNIKWLCWSCLHCFLDFGLMHPNFPVFSLTFENSRSTCFFFCFPYSTTKTYLWNQTGETVTGKLSLSPLSAVLPVLNVRGSSLLSSLCRVWWCISQDEIDILKSYNIFTTLRMLA